jgi:hypothetical protein
MNPLGIYKHLPKKNCGECAPKTCMAFAVSLSSDPEWLGQCRFIGPEERISILSMLGKGDWREELVRSLGDEVSALNLAEIAPGIGCFMRDDALIVRCMGEEYAVGSDGKISPDTRNPWIKILLLHYVRNRGRGEFTGKWVSFSELKGGLMKASTFQRECEEPLRRLMDEHADRATFMLERTGSSRVSGYPADHAWSLDLLPRIRTLILYHHGDEEFPSSLKMLFDAVTGEFIDVETLIFLCEGLVHTVERATRP